MVCIMQLLLSLSNVALFYYQNPLKLGDRIEGSNILDSIISPWFMKNLLASQRTKSGKKQTFDG